VENDFVGAHVGIMDPMAVSLADTGSALFLDTQSLAYEKIPLPLDEISFAVIHSGVVHRNAGGGYNERRAECERACAALHVTSLRAVSTKDLARIAALPEPLNRRARHVVTENERVLAAVRALHAKDWREMGALMAQSHASLRDDYAVSVPEIDHLVQAASAKPGCYGGRITGGGFGGSIILLCEHGVAGRVANSILRGYAARFGVDATVLLPR
jgi:galactokinase